VRLIRLPLPNNRDAARNGFQLGHMAFRSSLMAPIGCGTRCKDYDIDCRVNKPPSVAVQVGLSTFN
jgi:hypothetical protein